MSQCVNEYSTLNKYCVQVYLSEHKAGLLPVDVEIVIRLSAMKLIFEIKEFEISTVK